MENNDFYWNSNHNSFVNRVACNVCIHFWPQLNHKPIVSGYFVIIQSIKTSILFHCSSCISNEPGNKITFSNNFILLSINGDVVDGPYIHNISGSTGTWNIQMNQAEQWHQMATSWNEKGDQMMICRNERKINNNDRSLYVS